MLLLPAFHTPVSRRRTAASFDVLTPESPPTEAAPTPSFADRRSELLRRFGMPSCTELREILQKDAKLPDSVKLAYIKDYEAGLQDLCRQVARETASSGVRHSESFSLHIRWTVFWLPMVDSVLNVANSTLSQLRVGIMSYGEQILGQSGILVESNMYDECMQAMRAGTDCNALWQLEKELQQRLERSSAWSSKVWDYVNQAVRLVQKGSEILLKTAKEGVVMVFKGVWELFRFFLPYIVKVTRYMFSSPRAAVLTFMYAKHMQKRMCRFIARTYLLGGRPVPSQSLSSHLSEMAMTGKEYVENVGMSQLATGLGAVVKDTLLSHTDALVSGAVDMVSVGFPVAVPLVRIVGSMVKGTVKVGSEVMQDAAEFAVFQKDMDNAFSQLYEVLSFGECVNAWKATTLLSGRMNRYERNRALIEKTPKDEYLRVRSDDILRTMPTATNATETQAQKNHAKMIAEDELSLHEEFGKHPYFAGSSAAKWMGKDGIPEA